MIEEKYVNYKTAKLLKEKGFDEPLEMLIREDGTRYHADTNLVSRKQHIMLRNSEINMYSTDLSCPTQQMVMKWLREVHNIAINIGWGEVFEEDYRWWCIILDQKSGEILRDSEYYKTYEDACEAAIQYCLTNLI